MNQKSKSESNTWLLIIGIVLMIVIALYFIFRSEKIKQYKEDLEQEIKELKEKIKEKEQNVQYLTEQLNNLKQIKDYLVTYAKKLFIAVKLILLIILVGLGVVIYALLNFDVTGFIYSSVPIITTSYYIITVIVKNRMGDVNRALRLIQENFIDMVLRIKDFDDSIIEAVETELLKELEELNELRQKCLNYELKTATVSV